MYCHMYIDEINMLLCVTIHDLFYINLLNIGNVCVIVIAAQIIVFLIFLNKFVK